MKKVFEVAVLLSVLFCAPAFGTTYSEAKNAITFRLPYAYWALPIGLDMGLGYQRIIGDNQRIEVVGSAGYAWFFFRSDCWGPGLLVSVDGQERYVDCIHPYIGGSVSYQYYKNISNRLNWYAGLGIEIGGAGYNWVWKAHIGLTPQLGLEYNF